MFKIKSNNYNLLQRSQAFEDMQKIMFLLPIIEVFERRYFRSQAFAKANFRNQIAEFTSAFQCSYREVSVENIIFLAAETKEGKRTSRHSIPVIKRRLMERLSFSLTSEIFVEPKGFHDGKKCFHNVYGRLCMNKWCACK